MIQGGESFRLVVRRGPQPNQTYELNKDIITLGRDITNDIVINDPEVSRHHMRMTRGPGGFTIEDLGSTNGTFVNGQRVTGARPLRNGDMIGLGETVTLGYEMIVAAPPAAAGMTAPSPSMGAPGIGGASVPVSPAPIGDQPPAVPGQGYNPYTPPGSAPGAPPQGYSSPQPGAPAPSQPQGQGFGAAGQGYGSYNGGFNPPGQPQPVQGQYGANPASYAAAPSPTAPPMGGADYGYDPNAIIDTPPNNARWILIGCAGLGLFCCCSSVLGLVIIDAARLWDDIPIFSQTVTPILRGIGGALGLL
ncbi:MAG: FHA domain-containing protein [bacterium]|nr:FHA domain-containing protein [bacterium]